MRERAAVKPRIEANQAHPRRSSVAAKAICGGERRRSAGEVPYHEHVLAHREIGRTKAFGWQGKAPRGNMTQVRPFAKREVDVDGAAIGTRRNPGGIDLAIDRKSVV